MKAAMKAGIFVFLVTALATISSTLYAQNSADGVWNFVMSGPNGDVTAVVDLYADGTSLIGQFELSDGRIWPISNGSANGPTFSFELERGDSGVIYEMSGTVNGNQATGTATAMGTTREWSMTRAQ
ncbi:hypothetical protein QGM61_06300 [Pseudohongiella sp. SYSU M77423]|uniref:hypothetical protein n=1 Tax=unclassified Pseudohongiella TaxID=2629611 RepID=UPI001F34E5EB|nr:MULTISPECIES: hypothetical protein [unclassified Pseudohongiella]MDH7943425.1 hypothetical protein [Pseudohongiella sp. SYSU M77423]